MKKKFIIGITIFFILLLLCALFICLNKNSKKEEKNEKHFDEVIASYVILDINPSIKIELNKDMMVVNVTALNDDAKEIINDNFKEKTFAEEISILTNSLKEKNYLNDSEIIISLENIENQKVEDIINGVFENENISCELIIPNITESSWVLAEKYNISVGKAAYLEKEIAENPKLSIEDIKDLSVKEIKEKIEEIVEEPKRENNENTTPVTPSSKRPLDAQDKSGAWCKYNSSKAFNDTFDYPEMIGNNKAMQIGRAYVTSIDSRYITNESTKPLDDARGSYCRIYEYSANNGVNKYYIYIDSVTGEIIGSKTDVIPAPKISQEQAIQIGLSYFNLTDTSNCDLSPQVSYSESSNNQMKYTFAARCGGTQYSLAIDAVTGVVWDAITW